MESNNQNKQVESGNCGSQIEVIALSFANGMTRIYGINKKKSQQKESDFMNWSNKC